MGKSKSMAERYLRSESIRVLGNGQDERVNAVGGPQEGQIGEMRDEEMGQDVQNEGPQDNDNQHDQLVVDGVQLQAVAQDEFNNNDDVKGEEKEEVFSELVNGRLFFKDVDGCRKLADLELPGLLQLPTGSCEAVLLRVSRNNGFGYVPIDEYIRDRQTVLDKTCGNGIFLNSHDPDMKDIKRQ